tara:strand:- start:1931 stop:2374 length:444 start_codon:yes stop_codon:yes gene_type:complete
MAKYVLKNIDNSYCRICEDTESRDHWINHFVDISSYEEISDSDYTLIQKGSKIFTHPNPLNIALKDTTISEISFTEDMIREKLNNHINSIETLINNNENPPAIWATSLSTLKSINIDSLSYPITGYNWVDCLIKNNIQVPHSMEIWD